MDTIQEILDITSWILGGLLVGLLILGSYSFYQAYNTPMVPDLDTEPLQESDVEPEQNDRSFRDPEELQLVQKLSPKDPDQERSDANGAESDTGAVSKTVNQAKITETKLPFELLGTTTGFKGRELAIVRHMRDRQTKTLRLDEEWKSLRVVDIEQDHIDIQNTRNNKRERLKMAGSDT